MEITPTIFCTLDEETNSLVKEIYDLLSSEIREFHQHINLYEKDEKINRRFEDAIQYVRVNRQNLNHSARHLSTGRFPL